MTITSCLPKDGLTEIQLPARKEGGREEGRVKERERERESDEASYKKWIHMVLPFCLTTTK